jgi:membrane protein YqaA with SNARE-associated domain
LKQLVQTLIAWGPAGLFVVSILDSAGIPMVGGVDALLVLLAAKRPESAWLLIGLATVGSFAGSIFLYLLARRGGQAYLDRRTASGWGLRMRRWFERYGLLTVFIPAMCPVPPLPMKLFILSAGALGVRPWTFSTVLLAGRVLRYAGLAYLGVQLGEHSWGWLRAHVWHILALAALLSVAMLLVARIVERRRRLRKSTI